MFCGFLTCSPVHDWAPNDSGHMMPKANLLEYTATSKKLSVPKEPSSLTRSHTLMHGGEQEPLNNLWFQRLPWVSIPPQLSSAWKSQVSTWAGVSPALSACSGGEERFPKVICAFSLLSPSISSVFRMLCNGVGKNSFTIFITSGRFHIVFVVL